MTFTKETPRTSGWYLLKRDPQENPSPVEVFLDENQQLCMVRWGEDKRMRQWVMENPSWQMEWCRLVPAYEIEKAWEEGFRSGDCAGACVGDWDDSRAKRVMEGDV